MKSLTCPLLGACALLGSLAAAGADPFQKNLDLLRARAEAARPQPVAGRRVQRAPRRFDARLRRLTHAVQLAPDREDTHTERFVAYSAGRFGSKRRGGDLVVNAPDAEGPTHVYVGQRLLSSGGNGQARVPDLAPGKHPVMVWAPDANKRRTYWVTIRPGRVAELKAEL